MEALDRLASAMEALRKTDAKGQALTLSQMVRIGLAPVTSFCTDACITQSALLDTGSRHLVQVFIQWAKDTSATVDAGSLFDKGTSPFLPRGLNTDAIDYRQTLPSTVRLLLRQCSPVDRVPQRAVWNRSQALQGPRARVRRRAIKLHGGMPQAMCEGGPYRCSAVSRGV
jgi:hypothetical protein